MKKKTLNLLHRTYVEAVEQSTNIFEIIDNFHNMLSNVSTVDNEDSSQFDTFLKGVYSSKMTRKQTFKLTNLVTDITTVIMYMIVWLNSTKDMHIDINLTARRKALETELEKLLAKSEANNIANIHDRFGLRGIILNNTSSQESLDLLFQVSDYSIAILTRKNRKEYNLFLGWIEENKDIDNSTKEKIKFILNLPFRVDAFKDYVSNPKENKYQSLHYILVLEMFSDVLPGAELEIQLRTYSMHQNAINGTAAHKNYVKNRRPTAKNIFMIEDFSKVNIVGFYGYDSIDDDIDGVHFSKTFINRRISSTLV